jgi:hypothetical protein
MSAFLTPISFDSPRQLHDCNAQEAKQQQQNLDKNNYRKYGFIRAYDAGVTKIPQGQSCSTWNSTLWVW